MSIAVDAALESATDRVNAMLDGSADLTAENLLGVLDDLHEVNDELDADFDDECARRREVDALNVQLGELEEFADEIKAALGIHWDVRISYEEVARLVRERVEALAA